MDEAIWNNKIYEVFMEFLLIRSHYCNIIVADGSWRCQQFAGRTQIRHGLDPNIDFTSLMPSRVSIDPVKWYPFDVALYIFKWIRYSPIPKHSPVGGENGRYFFPLVLVYTKSFFFILPPRRRLNILQVYFKCYRS